MLFTLLTVLGLTGADFPHDEFLFVMQGKTLAEKRLIWDRAVAQGHGFPQWEEPDFDHFDGVMVVVFRRIAGKPLPYPQDPVFGYRKPFSWRHENGS